MRYHVDTMTTCGSRSLVAKTCIKCHVLKLASNFRRRAKTSERTMESYESWCTSCVAEKALRLNRQANDESLEKATHQFEVWTKDEVSTLARLERLGLSNRDIAERLGRSISATSNKLVTLRREVSAELKGVRLSYYDPTQDLVVQVGNPHTLSRKGHAHRLNKAAQELSTLHTQLIFFIEVDEGGEYMGIRNLDAFKDEDEPVPKEDDSTEG